MSELNNPEGFKHLGFPVVSYGRPAPTQVAARDMVGLDARVKKEVDRIMSEFSVLKGEAEVTGRKELEHSLFYHATGLHNS